VSEVREVMCRKQRKKSPKLFEEVEGAVRVPSQARPTLKHPYSALRTCCFGSKNSCNVLVFVRSRHRRVDMKHRKSYMMNDDILLQNYTVILDHIFWQIFRVANMPSGNIAYHAQAQAEQRE
jgi:hypothetical protein